MMMGLAFFGGASGITLAQNNGLSQGNVQVLNDQFGINPDKTSSVNPYYQKLYQLDTRNPRAYYLGTSPLGRFPDGDCSWR